MGHPFLRTSTTAWLILLESRERRGWWVLDRQIYWESRLVCENNIMATLYQIGLWGIFILFPRKSNQTKWWLDDLYSTKNNSNAIDRLGISWPPKPPTFLIFSLQKRVCWRPKSTKWAETNKLKFSLCILLIQGGRAVGELPVIISSCVILFFSIADYKRKKRCCLVLLHQLKDRCSEW